MRQCLIAIGCNQGNCQAQIAAALDQLDQLPDTRVVQTSSLRQTAPVGNTDQTFLNGAVLLQTGLPPAHLMTCLLELESSAGRQRGRDSGNRPLDLDILLFDDLSIQEPGLTIPHPRMSFRRFVLEPAAEIAAEWSHPELDCRLGELLNQLDSRPNVIAVVMSPAIAQLLQQQPDLCDRAAETSIVWQRDSAINDSADDPSAFTDDRWLVLMFDDDASIEAWADQIKLLIAPELTSGYRGPRWIVSDDVTLPVSGQATALVDQVMTAIASMQPAKGVVPSARHPL
ncbi:MAG: 2-amino-4-hydroxy-6-hydroxymethyldihydropteridine diphosphokinase [Pirellulaceae bacterium]